MQLASRIFAFRIGLIPPKEPVDLPGLEQDTLTQIHHMQPADSSPLEPPSPPLPVSIALPRVSSPSYFLVDRTRSGLPQNAPSCSLELNSPGLVPGTSPQALDFLHDELPESLPWGVPVCTAGAHEARRGSPAMGGVGAHVRAGAGAVAHGRGFGPGENEMSENKDGKHERHPFRTAMAELRDQALGRLCHELERLEMEAAK